jgi:putative cell wall-binding protein
MQTRGLTEDEAAMRIDAQPPAEDKIARADVIIDNSGSIEATRAQVVAAWQRIPGAPKVDAQGRKESPHRCARRQGKYPHQGSDGV